VVQGEGQKLMIGRGVQAKAEHWRACAISWRRRSAISGFVRFCALAVAVTLLASVIVLVQSAPSHASPVPVGTVTIVAPGISRPTGRDR